jgi:hypothetical protein
VPKKSFLDIGFEYKEHYISYYNNKFNLYSEYSKKMVKIISYIKLKKAIYQFYPSESSKKEEPKNENLPILPISFNLKYNELLKSICIFNDYRSSYNVEIKNNKGQTLSTEKFLNVSELRVWGRDNFIEIFSFVIGDRKLDSKTLNELTNLATVALMNKNIK